MSARENYTSKTDLNIKPAFLKKIKKPKNQRSLCANN